MTTTTNGTGLRAMAEYHCIVTTGEGWVEVRNTASNGTARVDMMTLSRDDQAWVLANVAGAFPRTVRPLSHEVIKRFGRLAHQQAQTNQQRAEQASATRTVRAVINRTQDGSGPTVEERDVGRMQKAVAALAGEKLYFVFYDIPQATTLGNPSGLLWHHGFRYQWSCWCLPERSLTHPDVVAWMRACREAEPVQVGEEMRRATVDVFPQAEETRTALLVLARERLRQEIIRAHTSLLTRIQDADKRLKEARENADLTWQEVEAADKRRDGTVRSILRSAIDDINAAVDCAKLFDETEAVADLLDGLRAAQRAQASAFNALASTKGIKTAPIARG